MQHPPSDPPDVKFTMSVRMSDSDRTSAIPMSGRTPKLRSDVKAEGQSNIVSRQIQVEKKKVTCMWELLLHIIYNIVLHIIKHNNFLKLLALKNFKTLV